MDSLKLVCEACNVTLEGHQASYHYANECRNYVMPKSPIIRQLNDISNNEVPSHGLQRLQKTDSHLDSRFADHPHSQLAAAVSS